MVRETLTLQSVKRHGAGSQLALGAKSGQEEILVKGSETKAAMSFFFGASLPHAFMATKRVCQGVRSLKIFTQNAAKNVNFYIS